MKVPRYFFGALIASVTASAMLASCANVPVDRGGSVAVDFLKSRSALAASVPVASVAGNQQAAVASVIAKPISADDAVRLALMQSPRMRELYSELGFAQADVYDATRLSNPVLGYVRLSAANVIKTTWSVSQSFTELLFIGYRSHIARSQLLQTQQRVANEVLALEADVRIQYYRYVGATLIAQMRSRAAETAKIAARYAQQLYDAGNISALQLSREQAAAGIADLNRRHALTEGLVAHSTLLSSMGMPLIDSQVEFVEQLPLPAAFSADIKSLQAWALMNRLDLAAAREAVTMWTANATHARRWRWFGSGSLGAERERETSGETLKGPSATLELPLFNQSGSQLLRARARLERETTKVAALELTIGNDMAVRYAGLQAAADSIEQYRQHVVPLHEHIVELTQQEQNFMLIGAFELLSAKQQQIDVYQSYLESVRDYWIEHAELMRVAGGNLPDGDKTQGSVGTGFDNRAAQGESGGNTVPPTDHGGHQLPDMPSTSGDKP